LLAREMHRRHQVESCTGIVELDAHGQAQVTLPPGFASDGRVLRCQLTCIGRFAPVYVVEEVCRRGFRIAGGEPGMKVYWQVAPAPSDGPSERARSGRRGGMSPRARQTLEALLSGASDKEIASRLGISVNTAQEYVGMLLKTYGVQTRLQLLASLLARCSCGCAHER
jgi:DNA-binding CsgD family transcriptional regulator